MRSGLPPLTEAVAEEVGEFGDGVDLCDRRIHVIFDAVECQIPAIHQHVGCAPVEIARLTHRADVHDRLPTIESVSAPSGVTHVTFTRRQRQG